MKTGTKLNVFTLVTLCCLFMGIAGCGDDEDKDEDKDEGNGGAANNHDCEVDIAESYASALKECEPRVAACTQDCSAPDDVDCMWDCEDVAFECLPILGMELAGCACGKQSADCVLDCGNDLDCQMGCASEYNDCAGADSPYICSSTCDANRYSCLDDCEHESATMDVYLECRSDCLDSATACIAKCD